MKLDLKFGHLPKKISKEAVDWYKNGWKTYVYIL